MNENEQLLGWLGWSFKKVEGYKVPGFWEKDGYHMMSEVPDFRTSNEWAGALLSKLERDYEIIFNPKFVHFQGIGYFGSPFVFSMAGPRPVWRDSIVDAALILIKREEL